MEQPPGLGSNGAWLFFPASDDRPLSLGSGRRESCSCGYGSQSRPDRPGDEILLMSGNYGDLWLNTNGMEISNSAFITVQAAPGQTPVLTSLLVAATNNWVFNGLKVQSLQSAARSGNALVEIKDGGAAFPTSNIVLENMRISSQDNAEAWSKGQWVTNARSGSLPRAARAARIQNAYRSPGRISAT